MIILACKKADMKDFFDRIIHLKIGEKHVHTEIIIYFESIKQHISFSARGRGKLKGCHFKQIKYSNPNRWDFYSMPHLDTHKVAFNCMLLDGKKYGYLEAKNWMKKGRRSKDYICFEICNEIAKLFPVTEKPTPKKMIKRVLELGGEKCSLPATV